MKRKNQQQQEDPEGIAQVGGRRKEFAVGQQDKCADNPGQDEEKRLPAIIGLQRNEPLNDIVPLMPRRGKNAGDANHRKDEPDPDQ
jgi:hypothetical protein